MSDFKAGVLFTAAVCSILSLLAYAVWFHHEAVWTAVVVGSMFCLVVMLCLAGIAFAIVTVGSLALSAWFGLEWCGKKAWSLFRRWRAKP